MGVTVCPCVHIYVCWWGEAEKSLTFSGRVRERKEGKGELRMAFSHSVFLTAFLYRSMTFLSILLIYLSSFHFLSIAFTYGLDRPLPPATALECPFGPFAVPLLLPSYRHTRKCANKQILFIPSDFWLLMICFASLNLTLCMSSNLTTELANSDKHATSLLVTT